MSPTLQILLLSIGGYLLGSLLPARWLIKWKTGKSVEELDENPGSYGTLERAGIIPASIVFAFDAFKGVLPVAIASKLGLENYQLIFPAISPIAGHNWSIFSKFKGGRGLASAIGAMTWLAYPVIFYAYLVGFAGILWKKWAHNFRTFSFPVLFAIFSFTATIVLLISIKTPWGIFWTAIAVMMTLFVRQIPWLVNLKRSKELINHE